MMRLGMPAIAVTLMLSSIMAVHAANDATGGALPSPPPARPRQAAPAPTVTSGAPRAADPEPSSPADAPKFSAEAKWLLAGYNNNEIVYTIVVTNLDARIIRCTTLVSGYYLDNGKKLGISDRQITTVFPNQPTQVGNWMDLDKESGATYSVKCRPV